MTKEERQLIGAKGGQVTAAQSEAKAAALRALHASRRGKRIHPDTREREIVLGKVESLVRDTIYGDRSIRAAAAFCKVSDRSLRRWLAGDHWPAPARLRRLEAWVRRHSRDATPRRKAS